MQLLDAFKLASVLHADQTDQAGRPYIEHLSRVFIRVVDAGGDRNQQIAALLHDAIEDGKATRAELSAAGVPEPALQLVELLTKSDEQRYLDYIATLKPHAKVVLIKRCDLEDNSDPVRLAKLPPKTAERLAKKYRDALATLATVR